MINEIHAFVIWHQAIPFFEYILQEIESTLEIMDIIQYTCNQTCAIAIQQKLYDISCEEAQKKCENNNFEKFIVIIVRIKHSIYIMTTTHWGTARVEEHMYTIKNNLRQKINIPFCIHSTINEKEAERDIGILTGKKSCDYINHSIWNRKIREIQL